MLKFSQKCNNPNTECVYTFKSPLLVSVYPADLHNETQGILLQEIISQSCNIDYCHIYLLFFNRSIYAALLGCSRSFRTIFNKILVLSEHIE